MFVPCIAPPLDIEALPEALPGASDEVDEFASGCVLSTLAGALRDAAAGVAGGVAPSIVVAAAS
jgi:hypothetical protein